MPDQPFSAEWTTWPKVTLTSDGYLRVSQAVAQQYFPNDTLLALRKGGQLILMPTRGPAGGGLILKQTNLEGDRAVLLAELFDFQSIPAGHYAAQWNEQQGMLTVAIENVPSSHVATLMHN